MLLCSLLQRQMTLLPRTDVVVVVAVVVAAVRRRRCCCCRRRRGHDVVKGGRRGHRLFNGEAAAR